MWKTLVLCSLVVALAGCENLAKDIFKGGSVAGKLESKGSLGDWTLEKGTCYSGEREKYFGALAHGPKGSKTAVKMVKDPVKGWSVLVVNPSTCNEDLTSCQGHTFTLEECKKLDVIVETRNLSVNDIKVVDGKLSMDCESGATSVRGELNFDYCH